MNSEQIDEIPSLCHNEDCKENPSDEESSSNDDEDDEWTEMDTGENESLDEIAECLFCNKQIKIIESIVIEHLAKEHQIDLKLMKQKFHMDQYSFIKMVNYIRGNKSKAELFRTTETAFWNDDKYLKPIKYETWLMFDFENIQSQSVDDADNNGGISKNLPNLAELNPAEVIKELSSELEKRNELLQKASEEISMLKLSIQKLFNEQDTILTPSKLQSNDVNDGNVGNIPIQQDQGYFSTYAHYGIHHDMLSDTVRTMSYRDAILNNSETIRDKIVLDLGCGTAILSMFASKAGAKKVISIDQSDIIYQAMDVVRKNNVENITFVKGRLEDTEIPDNKVDIIISEWMGYFLLFEGMLDSVIYARDHHLSPGGLLLPNRCNISIVGYGDEDRYKEMITFWDDVYGFDMSCLKKDALTEAIVEVCQPKHILTESNVIADLNLMTVDTKCTNFSYDFNLKVTKNGLFTSIVGYFDTFFDNLTNSITFSTGPHTKSTHWKQVIFYMKKTVSVKIGDVITGKFICRRDRTDARALTMQIDIFGQTLKYHMN